MTVGELISQLEKMPQDRQVRMLWDGACRSEVDVVYEAQAFHVVLAPYGESVWDDEDRPMVGPSLEEDPNWRVPYPPGFKLC